MSKNADLHTHSHYSDGQISPKNLVGMAKKRGLKYLALTDHNSIKGIKEAQKEGKKLGIEIIPGAEIRVDHGEVLAYFIDIKNKDLLKELARSNKQYQYEIKSRSNKLNKLGYNISWSELLKKFPKAKGNYNLFYPIYMMYLKGYGKDTFETSKIIKKYNLTSRQIKETTVIKAIKLIKKAGGVSVIAHPWVDPEVFKPKNIKKYVKAGLNGLEINNGDRTPFRDKRFDKLIKSTAKKYNLIITSGSDYHGEPLVKLMKVGDHNIGHNNCDESVVNKLRKLAKN